jgi:hypothetical protein
MRRIDNLIKRIAALEELRGSTVARPMVLASGEIINISGSDLHRLLRKVDGKTRGLPSQFN